jgi:diguanylate cyclase (GGDEF)-like protein
MAQFVDDPRLRGLAALARSLGRSAELVVMLELAAEGALIAIDAASVSISRQEPGTGTVRTLINVGRLGPSEERWPEDEVYQVDDFLVDRAWSGMSAQLAIGELRIAITSVGDPDGDPEEIRLLRSLEKASAMSAPLVVDGKLWGELYATRETEAEPFGATDEAYAEALCAILSGAVSRALHTDALGRMAFLDPLTGLANRRALDDAAATAFDGISLRSGRRVSAVTVDVNGLKTVNDTSGHGEGDRLLTQVGTLLYKHFAHLNGSLVARVGGDEFCILVPGHRIDHVVAAARAACSAARELPVGEGLSCGIATTTEYGHETARQLFTASDTAQYRAKRHGILEPVAAEAPYGYEDAAEVVSLARLTQRLPRSAGWTPGIVESAPPAG